MREKTESYLTTGQFSSLGRGYIQHCGPTAITNITMTLTARKTGQLPDDAEAEIRFKKIIRIGRRPVVYMNTDLFHLLGGTLDRSIPYYLKRSLKAFGMNGCRISRIRRLKTPQLQEYLSAGCIIYLIMRRHPVYGNHHMVCYGLEKRGLNAQDLFLRVADGWSSNPKYLPESDLRYTRQVLVEYDEGAVKH